MRHQLAEALEVYGNDFRLDLDMKISDTRMRGTEVYIASKFSLVEFSLEQKFLVPIQTSRCL